MAAAWSVAEAVAVEAKAAVVEEVVRVVVEREGTDKKAATAVTVGRQAVDNPRMAEHTELSTCSERAQRPCR